MIEQYNVVTGTAVSGYTRVAGVIGDPVSHSLSPTIHNAAFAAAGLDFVFVALPVKPQMGADAVEACRVLGLVGLSVTMPHKAIVAATVDDLSPQAAKLGAVNCVRRDRHLLIGENTDGDGFISSLRNDADFDPANKNCVVLGAGGAGRAVILALAEAGARQVIVVNRTKSAAEDAVLLAPRVARVGQVDEVIEADLIVNATPIGMAGGSRDSDAFHRVPLDQQLLGSGQLVADLIYHPEHTALLQAAAKQGARILGGVGMLVRQAAIAFTHWTGESAPVSDMRAAANKALALRQ